MKANINRYPSSPAKIDPAVTTMEPVIPCRSLHRSTLTTLPMSVNTNASETQVAGVKLSFRRCGEKCLSISSTIMKRVKISVQFDQKC